MNSVNKRVTNYECSSTYNESMMSTTTIVPICMSSCQTNFFLLLITILTQR